MEVINDLCIIPNCHTDIRLVKPTTGDNYVYPGCSMLWMVIKLAPIELDFHNEMNNAQVEEFEPENGNDWDS